MTKFPRKNVPDAEIKLGAAYMPSKHASDQATKPGNTVIMAYCLHKLIVSSREPLKAYKVSLKYNKE